MSRNMNLGNPALHPDEDEFNRHPFSRALARQLASIGNAEGAPVIGLYGKWGYGKSTVLNFVKYYLLEEHSSQVVLFEFNPWLYQTQEALLTAFYTGLAAKMDESLKNTSHKIGEFLAKYSGSLSLIPAAGGTAGGLTRLGEQLSSDPIEQQHQRISAIMRTADRTVVVLIDDLDRLDRAEVMTMLKLVRLTANLPHVVYLLAFDDDIIAQVAGASYGSPDAGRQFLEKIVQFPFSIPTVGQQRLVNYVLRHAQRSCERAEVTLSGGDWRNFSDLVERCLAPRLATPRQAIRFGSALDFALPMMKGEVDPVQQMLVEGLRVIFPGLCTYIRDHGRLFSGAMTRDSISQHLAQAKTDHVEDAKALVEFLFMSDPTTPQSITNPRYFERYFAYALAADEINERELEMLIGSREGGVIGDLIGKLARRNPSALLHILAQQLNRISESQAAVLAHELAQFGPLFTPDSQGMLSESRTQDLIELLAELVRSSTQSWEQTSVRDGTIESQRIREEHLAKTAAEERARVARDIVHRLEPIILGPEFLRELIRRRSSAALENAPQLFDEEGLSTLNETLIARIRALGNDDPIALLSDQSSQSQLFAWWRFNAPASLHAWLDDILKHNPVLVMPVLRGIVDSPFNMEHKFREIVSVASPSTICEGLYKVYGDALIGEAGGEADRYDLEIARCFLLEFRRQSQPSDVSPTPAQTTA